MLKSSYQLLCQFVTKRFEQYTCELLLNTRKLSSWQQTQLFTLLLRYIVDNSIVDSFKYFVEICYFLNNVHIQIEKMSLKGKYLCKSGFIQRFVICHFHESYSSIHFRHRSNKHSRIIIGDPLISIMSTMLL